MSIEQLSKEETRTLEETTTPIVNMYNGVVDSGEFVIDDMNVGMAITCWYVLYDVNPNRFQEKRDKLIELLGLKPNYHVNYEYKNAVWGLEINGHRCVLYTSIKGTSLQVEKDGWKPGDMQKFLTILKEKLIDPDILKEDTEKVQLFINLTHLP